MQVKCIADQQTMFATALESGEEMHGVWWHMLRGATRCRGGDRLMGVCLCTVRGAKMQCVSDAVQVSWYKTFRV